MDGGISDAGDAAFIWARIIGKDSEGTALQNQIKAQADRKKKWELFEAFKAKHAGHPNIAQLQKVAKK